MLQATLYNSYSPRRRISCGSARHGMRVGRRPARSRSGGRRGLPEKGIFCTCWGMSERARTGSEEVCRWGEGRVGRGDSAGVGAATRGGDRAATSTMARRHRAATRWRSSSDEECHLNAKLRNYPSIKLKQTRIPSTFQYFPVHNF
jgi:hypothetical protein